MSLLTASQQPLIKFFPGSLSYLNFSEVPALQTPLKALIIGVCWGSKAYKDGQSIDIRPKGNFGSFPAANSSDDAGLCKGVLERNTQFLQLFPAENFNVC